MKRLAILNYLVIFDPSETGFSSASQYEAFYADFCAAHGIDANVVETAGSGAKAIYLSRMEVLTSQANSQPAKSTVPQDVKKVQNQTPPTNFKQFKNPKKDNIVAPKLNFQVPGRTNRMKGRNY